MQILSVYVPLELAVPLLRADRHELDAATQHEHSAVVAEKSQILERRYAALRLAAQVLGDLVEAEGGRRTLE